MSEQVGIHAEVDNKLTFLPHWGAADHLFSKNGGAALSVRATGFAHWCLDISFLPPNVVRV
jgi:hypothetical protein